MLHEALTSFCVGELLGQKDSERALYYGVLQGNGKFCCLWLMQTLQRPYLAIELVRHALF